MIIGSIVVAPVAVVSPTMALPLKKASNDLADDGGSSTSAGASPNGILS